MFKLLLKPLLKTLLKSKPKMFKLLLKSKPKISKPLLKLLLKTSLKIRMSTLLLKTVLRSLRVKINRIMPCRMFIRIRSSEKYL
jgi:hypothetical protein